MRVEAWFAICATFGAPLNHRIGIRLCQGIAGELAGRTAVSLEQHRLRVVRESGAVNIFMQVGFEIVMAGHGMLLATLLLQAQPEPPVLRIHVFDNAALAGFISLAT